jgi:hypothetical protein
MVFKLVIERVSSDGYQCTSRNHGTQRFLLTKKRVLIRNHGFQTSYRESHPTVINALLVTMVLNNFLITKKTSFDT